MHSFHEISQYLTDGTFCLTTVDTIFREEEFKAYVEELQRMTDEGEAAVSWVAIINKGFSWPPTTASWCERPSSNNYACARPTQR